MGDKSSSEFGIRPTDEGRVELGLGSDFFRSGGEERLLLVAQEIVERDAPLLRHKDSLPYLGVDDEFLLVITD